MCFPTWKVELSKLGFGCWGLGGGWGRVDDTQAQAALRRAVELGINFFDTAFIYGQGHSEEIVGRALRPVRNKVYIATKVPAKTMEWPATPQSIITKAFPVDWFVRCTETSLRRLGLERLDLQQMHVWTDAWVDSDEWRKAVQWLKKEGKIRSFGVSVNDHEPDSVLKLVATGEIDSVQVIYNIFDQTPAEKLFPLCQEHGVKVIVRVPFDEGALTGLLKPGMRFEPDDWRAGYFKGERLTETLDRVERLQAFLGPDAPELPSLALKFAMGHPAVSTVIPGMRKVSHVEANAAIAAGKPLPADTLHRLREHAWPRNFYQGAWE